MSNQPVIKKDLYFRCLVFQPTGHILWVHRELSPWQSIPRRIPNVSKDLDYKLYTGDFPSDYNWFQEFKKYRLIKSKEGLNHLKVGDLPDEFKEKAKILRAKCYAMWTVINAVAYNREKLDLVSNPIISADPEDLTKLYQKFYNIDRESAEKLVKFKREEIEFNDSKLSLTEIEAELALAKATTLEEVIKQHDLNCTWLLVKSERINSFLTYL